MPELPGVLRCFSVLLTFVGLVRNVDLLRLDWPLAKRLAHVASVVDTRKLTSVPRALDTKNLLVSLAWNAVAWPVYYFVLPLASRVSGAGYWVLDRKSVV